MTYYTGEELDTKIHGFLNRKFEKFPELSTQRQLEDTYAKQNLKTRLVHSLTNNIVLLSN